MAGFVSFRSMVDPSDCDFLGHMNVSRYFAACSDGVATTQSQLGLTAEDMRSGRQISFAVVNAESDFVKELRAGDSIWLETSIETVGTKSLTFRHMMFRAPDDTLVFSTRFKCVMLDLRTRRSTDVPDDVRERAAVFMS